MTSSRIRPRLRDVRTRTTRNTGRIPLKRDQADLAALTDLSLSVNHDNEKSTIARIHVKSMTILPPRLEKPCRVNFTVFALLPPIIVNSLVDLHFEDHSLSADRSEIKVIKSFQDGESLE